MLTGLWLLLAPALYAENRIYQYYVKSPGPLSEGRLVTSTLDPVSYEAYHGGPASLRVDLLRSWVCFGHNRGGPFPCPPPLSFLPEEEDPPLATTTPP